MNNKNNMKRLAAISLAVMGIMLVFAQFDAARMNREIKELQKTLKELGTNEANAGLRKTLESQISILQRNLAAAEASYRNLDDDEDDPEITDVEAD